MDYLVPTLDEYYLWRKKSDKQFPWERSYFEREFLKFEKKRINEVRPWWKIFLKKQDYSKLEEVAFYTLPIQGQISRSWRAAIADEEGYSHIGLSVFSNSPQMVLFGLIPYGVERPRDYELIRLINPQKIIIFNKRINQARNMVMFSEWSYEESDTVYQGLKVEKNIISKIFTENNFNDYNFAKCLQQPVVSSPIIEKVGGIGVSSVSKETNYAKNLLKTLQLMVPPEYRCINPPRVAMNGYSYKLCEGINFRLAERPLRCNHYLSGFHRTNDNHLKKEMDVRRKFGGEYSIFSSQKLPSGTQTEIMKNLYLNFSNIEITIPYEIEKFNWEELYLKDIIRDINEDLWIQVFQLRNKSITPPKDEYKIKTLENIKADLSTILEKEFRYEEDLFLQTKFLSNNTIDNICRMGLSIARSENENRVKMKHLNQATKLTMNNLGIFPEHPEIS